MGEEITKITVPIYSAKATNVEELISGGEVPDSAEVVDITPGALVELYEIKHPEKKDKYIQEEFESFLKVNDIELETYGNYIYYSWRNQLLKVPPIEDLRLLRTARNQLLITPEEQKILFEKTILIAGMSVGSNAVEQLVHGGIGGSYILADMDTLEITNLNRIKTGLIDVTLPKVISSARRALELDPYLEITILEKGIQEKFLEQVCEEFVIDIFVDEVDDISAKLLLRQKAKQLDIPLLMATDNSDGALIDIERYDIDPDSVFFNNRIPDQVLQKMISGELSREESGAAIGMFFVGLDIVDNRLLSSLLQVRKSIPSWPQLGTAASMSGVLVAFAAKKILLGGVLNSDRYVSSFDKDMDPEFNTEDYAIIRQNLMSEINKRN